MGSDHIYGKSHLPRYFGRSTLSLYLPAFSPPSPLSLNFIPYIISFKPLKESSFHSSFGLFHKSIDIFLRFPILYGNCSDWPSYMPPLHSLHHAREGMWQRALSSCANSSAHLISSQTILYTFQFPSHITLLVPSSS